MLSGDATLKVIGKMLDGCAARHNAIAANLANAETPGYKRVDVRFEEQLAKAIDSGDARQIDAVRPETVRGTGQPRCAISARCAAGRLSSRKTRRLSGSPHDSSKAPPPRSLNRTHKLAVVSAMIAYPAEHSQIGDCALFTANAAFTTGSAFSGYGCRCANPWPYQQPPEAMSKRMGRAGGRSIMPEDSGVNGPSATEWRRSCGI